MRVAVALLVLAISSGCSHAFYEGRDEYAEGMAHQDAEPELARPHFERAKARLTEAVEAAGFLKASDDLEARSMLIRCALELSLFHRAEKEISKAADTYADVPTLNPEGDRIGFCLIRSEIARRRTQSPDPEISMKEITSTLTELFIADRQVLHGPTKRFVALALVRMLERKAELHLKHLWLGEKETQSQAKRALRSGIALCREWLIHRTPSEVEFRRHLKSMEEVLDKLPHD